MKKTLILTLIILIIAGSSVFAKERLQLQINGEMQPKDTLINVQGFELVPLGIPANIYGYTTEYIVDSSSAVLTRGGETIVFKKDDNRVFINGREKLMITTARIINNKMYVPIEVFRLCFNKSIIFEPELNAMVVTEMMPEQDNTPSFGEIAPKSKFSPEMINERPD